MAAAVWCSCLCLRSWSRSSKLSPFPSFRLWSGSRNSGGVPVLHRQRVGRYCWQQRFRASDSVHRIGNSLACRPTRASKRADRGVTSACRRVEVVRVGAVRVRTVRVEGGGGAVWVEWGRSGWGPSGWGFTRCPVQIPLLQKMEN